MREMERTIHYRKQEKNEKKIEGKKMESNQVQSNGCQRMKLKMIIVTERKYRR